MRYIKWIIFVLFIGGILYICGRWIMESRDFPVCSASSHKVVHISFDDVVQVLKDLKDNSACYESIFRNTFLRNLKELHDKYGACFSLYVFEQAGDFHITDMPDKFRNEFKTNASWLKFGFHAVSPEFDRQMSFRDFQASFENVYRAICHFADTASLSPVLRLHYFWGNDSVVSLLRDYGIKGLLCADDERDSYNLSKEENKVLQQKFYLEKDLKYFKTDLRYEKMRYMDEALERIRNRDTLVLFTHEWAYLPLTLRQEIACMVRTYSLPPNWFAESKLEKSIKWLKNHGYEFSFLE